MVNRPKSIDVIVGELGNKVTRLFAILNNTPPHGSISMFGGSTAPNGWLLCNGAQVSRTDYADLFAAIGTAYGIGDGSTTFNIPDFTAAFPRGNTPASSGGAATHTHPLSDAGQAAIAVSTANPFGWLRRVVSASYTPTHTIGGSTATAAFSTAQAVATGLLGNTDAASTLPPYVGVAFIIKI